MDNTKFGVFIAALRRDLGLTQKELADNLNITDKAVSKWETGKGFPDIKLMEPLAQVLGVTVVELIRCERQNTEHLTVAEAGEVVSLAMDQAQRVTTRRYLKLLRWLLIGVGVCCAYTPLLWLIARLHMWLYFHTTADALGVIGGADGPTTIITSTAQSGPLMWLTPAALMVIAIACLVLVLRVRKLEKDLKSGPPV